MRFEICVDSVSGVEAAVEAKADRVELCANLFEGGVTPSIGTVEEAVKAASGRLKVHVLIRPRGGDFVYTPAEVQVMLRDIAAAKNAGADGLVVGALTAEATIDVDVSRQLAQAAAPASVTFHRAFDVTRDPRKALTDVLAVGADRLLTSGAAPTALEGAELIAHLMPRAGEQIIILPAGGITERTAARVVNETGATELHFTAAETLASPSTFSVPGVHMGGALHAPEITRQVTTPARIHSIVGAAGR